MGNKLIASLAFRAPECTYSSNLKDLVFVTRHNELMCSNKSPVAIPIREYFIDSNLPTILWCHGNGMDIGSLDLVYLSTLFNANIVTFDYASYGLNSNKIATEQDCYADVEAVYYQHLLPKVKDVSKIAIIGHSLGSTMACHLAFVTRHDTRKPKNLLLISPLYSATTIKTWFPLWFIDCFKNYKLAPFIPSAVSIYHSETDELISFECAKELSFLFKNLVQLRTTYNKTHNETLEDAGIFQSIRKQIHL